MRRRGLRAALLPLIAALAPLLAAAGCTDALPTASPPAELPPFSVHARATTEAEQLALLHAPAHITLHGSTIRFTGVIHAENASALLNRARRAPEPIDTLVINSLGGSTISGKTIGDWVHENGIAVAVHDVCFSSCANYIFTAAPRKIIRDGAIVAWHGSEQQRHYLAETLGLSLEEYADREIEEQIDQREAERGRAFSEEEREDLRNSGWAAALRAFLLFDDGSEQRFLDRIGVQVEALVYGLMGGRYDIYLESESAGWTFGIEDMAAFGIDEVTYEGKGEYPSAAAAERYRVLLFRLG